MRHHPEGRWRLTPERLQTGADLLLTLAHAAARLLEPGGRLLYATCSLEPEENERVVEALLTTTPELRERYPRINFQLDNAVWEALDETPGKSRIFSLQGGAEGPVAVTEGGPGTEVLEGTPYIVGSDSTPAFSTSPILIAFRRLTGTGNGGLGTWDIMTLSIFSEEEPVVVAGGGGVYRGAPDWSTDGRIVFVETDMASNESRLVVIQADGSERQVLHVEDAGFRMASPRWLR